MKWHRILCGCADVVWAKASSVKKVVSWKGYARRGGLESGTLVDQAPPTSSRGGRPPTVSQSPRGRAIATVVVFGLRTVAWRQRPLQAPSMRHGTAFWLTRKRAEQI